MKRVKLLFPLLPLLFTFFVGQAQPSRIAFWNVENFFDTRNDSLTNDDAFTPQGTNHWTSSRFNLKSNNIFKTLVALDAPMVVGLAEVENSYVLSQLCFATPLRKFGYDFIHFDSPDPRGIDCALLYRRPLFHPFHSSAITVSDSATRWFSRDLLLVGGTTSSGDSLFLLVCHLPSKLGAALADHHRARIAHRIRALVDSLSVCHPCLPVFVMGDFNADPRESAFCASFGFPSLPLSEAYPADALPVNPEGLLGLMYAFAEGEGSCSYADRWSFFDQFLVRIPACSNFTTPVAQLFRPDFLLKPSPRSQSVRPFRTYSGPNYLGGFSDHLPIYLDLEQLQ
ncbi:MAG: endonuclease/exonuclease/phosphatase family protein [Bacteroidales bacterium]|nr:endonuclease/exonuclease/phosphatase family protein [Bacteroidales bacterium]